MRDAATSEPSKPSFGGCIKNIRRDRKWTLKELSLATGIPISTLSKVERGLLSLSFANIQKLAAGLNLNISNLIVNGEEELLRQSFSNQDALRSITRLNQADIFATDKYRCEVHGGDIQNKHMETMVVKITCRDISDYQDLQERSHLGEEFIYILEGKIRIYTEYYEPEDLVKGESIYLNAGMWHAAISLSRKDALVLSVCSYGRRRAKEFNV